MQVSEWVRRPLSRHSSTGSNLVTMRWPGRKLPCPTLTDCDRAYQKKVRADRKGDKPLVNTTPCLCEKILYLVSKWDMVPYLAPKPYTLTQLNGVPITATHKASISD